MLSRGDLMLADIKEMLVLHEYEKEIIRQAGTTLHFSKDEVIFSAGDMSNQVYLIEEGWVKIYRLSKEGNPVMVGSIRRPGELMGLAEALCGMHRTCFAGALSDAVLTVLDKDDFQELLDCDPRLSIKVAKLLACRMRKAESNLHQLSFRDIPERLAQVLLEVAEGCGSPADNGISLNLNLTYEELAAMVGASPHNITAFLRVLQDENSLHMDGNEVKGLNPKKLYKYIM